jgi:hypothetical protein
MAEWNLCRRKAPGTDARPLRTSVPCFRRRPHHPTPRRKTIGRVVGPGEPDKANNPKINRKFAVGKDV